MSFIVSGVVGSDNELLAVVECLVVDGMQFRMSSILLAAALSLLLCAELLQGIRDGRHYNVQWAAYLVLGGICILFRVNVSEVFPVPKSIANVGSFCGEELAWYGNVLAFFGDDCWYEVPEGWRRCSRSWTAGSVGAWCEVN